MGSPKWPRFGVAWITVRAACAVCKVPYRALTTRATAIPLTNTLIALPWGLRMNVPNDGSLLLLPAQPPGENLLACAELLRLRHRIVIIPRDDQVELLNLLTEKRTGDRPRFRRKNGRITGRNEAIRQPLRLSATALRVADRRLLAVQLRRHLLEGFPVLQLVLHRRHLLGRCHVDAGDLHRL